MAALASHSPASNPPPPGAACHRICPEGSDSRLPFQPTRICSALRRIPLCRHQYPTTEPPRVKVTPSFMEHPRVSRRRQERENSIIEHLLSETEGEMGEGVFMEHQKPEEKRERGWNFTECPLHSRHRTGPSVIVILSLRIAKIYTALAVFQVLTWAINTLIPLILTTNLRGRYCHYLRRTDERLKAQRA